MSTSSPASRSVAVRRWRRLALALGTTLAGLLVAEAIYRVNAYGLGGLSLARMNSTRTLGRSGILQSAENPEVRFELKPGLNTLVQMVVLETNSRGLRDKEYTLSKPPGTWRVAFVGDSFTMGLGVEADHIYHSVLEQRWNASSPGISFECINFGVAAYGLTEYAGVIKHKVLQYDPDVIVMALTANDKIRTNLSVHVDKDRTYPFFRIHCLDPVWSALQVVFGGSSGQAANPPRKNPRSDVARSRAPDAASPSRPHARCTHAPSSVDPEALRDTLPADTMDYIREYFGIFRKISVGTGVPIVAVHLTQNWARSPWGTINSQAFRKAAAESGIPYLDTNSCLEGRELDDNIIFKTDTHPNAEVNALFADAIGDYLAGMGLLGR